MPPLGLEKDDGLIDFMFLALSLPSFYIRHLIHIRDYDFEPFLNNA